MIRLRNSSARAFRSSVLRDFKSCGDFIFSISIFFKKTIKLIIAGMHAGKRFTSTTDVRHLFTHETIVL